MGGAPLSCPYLRLDDVAIGRKSLGLHQNLAAFPGRAEEGNKHEVDVRGEPVGNRDLGTEGTDDSRCRRLHEIVDLCPVPPLTFKMTTDP